MLSAKQLGKLARRAAGGSITPVYTVPSDHRAIVRDIRLHVVDTAQTVQVIADVTGAAAVKLLYREDMPAYEAWTMVDGFLVLEAGDSLSAWSNNAAGIDIIVSGHEFAL